MTDDEARWKMDFILEQQAHFFPEVDNSERC